MLDWISMISTGIAPTPIYPAMMTPWPRSRIQSATSAVLSAAQAGYGVIFLTRTGTVQPYSGRPAGGRAARRNRLEAATMAFGMLIDSQFDCIPIQFLKPCFLPTFWRTMPVDRSQRILRSAYIACAP